ncbi:hypothetical protein ACHAPU_011280 [Fusarium lateritium]
MTFNYFAEMIVSITLFIRIPYSILIDLTTLLKRNAIALIRHSLIISVTALVTTTYRNLVLAVLRLAVLCLGLTPIILLVGALTMGPHPRA